MILSCIVEMMLKCKGISSVVSEITSSQFEERYFCRKKEKRLKIMGGIM
jgi:hypothetical protein